MAGASSSTALGLFYRVVGREPKYTLVTCHATGVFRICEKVPRNKKDRTTFKKVIAEFLREEHAEMLLKELQKDDRT